MVFCKPTFVSRRSTRRPRAQPVPATPVVRSRSGQSLGIAAALVALTWWSFRDVGSFSFLAWDDPTYIRDNANVLAGLSWSNIVWALTTGHQPYWHPLTWM